MTIGIHETVKPVRAISPVAIGTTGTGQTGKVVDRKGYRRVEFLVEFGTITAVNAAFTVTVKEGDVTGTLTSVADGDLDGLEASAVPATGTRTSGTTKNAVYRIGYKGLKRYVQCNVKSTVTAGTPVSVTALLSRAESEPVSPAQ